jgi:hypothetical protein
MSDVGIEVEHAGKAVFRDDGDFEVGTSLFQQMEGGSGEDAIAERPKANDGDAAAGREPVEGIGLRGHAGGKVTRR